MVQHVVWFSPMLGSDSAALEPKEIVVEQGERIYGTFSLTDEIRKFPPDPDSKARHRAETLVKISTLRVVLVTMLEGGELQEHDAPGPITVQVLEGRISLSVEGETRELQAGELISLAPGIKHAVRGIESGAFLLTIAHLSREPDPGGRHNDADV